VATISLIAPIAGRIMNVDGGVRIEPEEVLEEHGVAAVSRVEDADVEEALGPQAGRIVIARTASRGPGSGSSRRSPDEER